jgi:hypothetical protein
MTRTSLRAVVSLWVAALCIISIHAEDLPERVKKAVQQTTLDQPGTEPFHLKATYSPSFERDKDSHRTGEIEIWWESPTKWRREVSSPEFHQIAIMDGTHQWQKNDGDYFPNWLRELAQAIVQPIPLPTDVLLQRVKTAEVRILAGQTNLDWNQTSGFADAQSNGKGHMALMNQTGLLFFSGGLGWSGEYHDFRDFHGRMIAFTVDSGTPQLTAKVSVIEDLKSPSKDLFDTSAPGGDPQLIETVAVDEAELRKNLISQKPFSWPQLADGPLEGVVWTEVVIDRNGKIHEMLPPIADNAGVKSAADQGFRAMQFQPILRDGAPVQAISKLSVPFKTTRPAGVENFDSAHTYFERGRTIGCLGAGALAPYTLRAEFQTGTGHGTVDTGRYQDTWISKTQWKREAWFGTSHLVRAQSGDTHYQLSEGPEAKLLSLVMLLVEPIPAGDTMTESDWRIKRDLVDGTKTIRVFRGPEGPNGELEPGRSQGYWFAENGQLVKTYTSGFDIRPSDIQPYDGVQIPRQIDLIQGGKLALRFTVKEIGTADPAASKSFPIKGHEWKRQFTAEVR